MAKKISGKRFRLIHGFEVYVNHQPAKTAKGKDRIWIHIRQPDKPKWVNDESLMYVNSADIRFVWPVPKGAKMAKRSTRRAKKNKTR
jgi:hypothetical protein